jgi:hypothetical protein
MLAKRRALADAANEANAIQALLRLGWDRSITERGLTLTEPPKADPVKTDA